MPGEVERQQLVKFHLISLLRRQLSSLCRLRDISLRPEGVFPQGEAENPVDFAGKERSIR